MHRLHSLTVERTLTMQQDTNEYINTIHEFLSDIDKLSENADAEKRQSLEKMVSLLHTSEHLTFYDKDLDIPNITYFTNYVDACIAQGRISSFCVCYFTLNRFSNIYQQFGKEHGTQVLHSFVHFMTECFSNPKEEFVCRISGDNFLAIFYKEHTDAVAEYLTRPEITICGLLDTKILLSVSAGFYQIPDTPCTAADIIDRVTIANNAANNEDKDSLVFYDAQLLQHVNDEKMVQSLFADALQKEEFLVYYQPKVFLKNYKLIGAEALCRWKHNGKIIPPARFIPVLEKSNAICALDFYMLDHVCRDIRKWLDEGLEVVKISVNLSRCHFGNVNLLQDIFDIIDKYHVPHKYIEIELTETTTDVSFKDLKEIVSGLQLQGISTAVDDFGTGYSSLNLVRELPWDVLKIDKSFLSDSADAPSQNRVMLKHIIAMSQEMGISTIVEGVENLEHVKLLKENNCFLAQGFCFDKPLPKEAFQKRLEELM